MVIQLVSIFQFFLLRRLLVSSVKKEDYWFFSLIEGAFLLTLVLVFLYTLCYSVFFISLLFLFAVVHTHVLHTLINLSNSVI